MPRARLPNRTLDLLLSLDFPLLLGVAVLLGLGLVLIDSSTFAVHGRAMVLKQGAWILLGALAFSVVSAVPVTTLRHHAMGFWVVCLLLVLLTYGLGVEAFGARRWLAIGGLRFQPSEFLKLATVLVLARVAEEYVEDERATFGPLVRMGLCTAVSFLVIAKQPDLGTAATLLAVAGGMLVVMGLPLWALFSLVVLGLIPIGFPSLLALLELPVTAAAALQPILALTAGFLVAAGVARFLRVDVALWKPFVVYAALVTGMLLGPRVWQGLNPYQRLRLTGFLAPELDPRGSGYNLIQSLIAVGSGGLEGQGLRKGAQTNLGFLPHKHTDFIFSVLGEELGFVGVCVLLVALVLVLGRMFLIAARAHSAFGALAVTGAATLLSFQALVNLGMAMGLAPITGLPLPFVSYGGSSMIGCWMLLGLAQAVALEPSHSTSPVSDRRSWRMGS